MASFNFYNGFILIKDGNIVQCGWGVPSFDLVARLLTSSPNLASFMIEI